MKTVQRNAARSSIAILAVLAGLTSSPAAGQTAVPPRSTADILAVLDEFRPDPKRINRLREIVARQPPQSSDPIDQTKFYLERGRAAGELGMLNQQLDDLHKAFGLFEEGDWRQYRALLELARAEIYAGDYGAAMKLYAQAPHLAPFDGQRLSAWAALSAVRAEKGDLPGARTALAEAESIRRKLSGSTDERHYSRAWEAALERSRGHILRYEGKFAEAEAAYRKTLTVWVEFMEINRELIRKKLPTLSMANATRTRMVWEHHYLAPVLVEQSKFSDAELTLREALKRALNLFGRYSSDTAAILVKLANVLFEQGRFDESTALAKAAVDVLAKIGAAPYSRLLAFARRDVAAALVEEGRFAEAVAEFEAMNRGLAQSPSAAAEGVRAGHPSWIYALTRIGRTGEAIEWARRHYKSELEIYGEHVYSTIEARGFLALAIAADGKHEEALQEFRATIPVLLIAARERSGEESSGLARTLRFTRVLEAYIALLGRFSENGAAPRGLDPVAEAFMVADVARGSSVQRALTAASARAAIHDLDLARLAREEQDIAQRVASLITTFIDLVSRPPAKQLTAAIVRIRENIGTLRNDRIRMMEEIAKRFPDYANLVNPKPITLEVAREMLVPGEALIVTYGLEDQTFVWAVPHRGPIRFHVSPLGRKTRKKAIAGLRRALDVGNAPLARFPDFDITSAYQLYATLLEPLEPAWGRAKSLLVVPHGSLGQLPFTVLVTTPSPLPNVALPFESYRQVAWLVRRVAITQLPSVNTLASLRSKVGTRVPAKPFVGFGDPSFGTQRRAAVFMEKQALRVRSAPFSDLSSARKAISVRLSSLAPLPDTAEELTSIAKTLGANPQADVFLETRASEQNVKGTDLSDRRVVAFATHGLVPGDLDGLTQPALALSNPALTGEKDADGLLTMEEILGLRLDADWVVLSACNTAAGDGAGSEAVSGLGRAFFYAGARALLVSNWPVETVSAKLLTTEVFRRQAGNPKLGRAEALRQAMLHVMMDETAKNRDGKPLFSYAHPMFWAPFSLIGDGR